MATSTFHVAMTNALARALPPEEAQDYDIDVVVDQCIALLERAGWEFARRPLATSRPVGAATGAWAAGGRGTPSPRG
jgi:hypothetical protein